MGSLMSVFSGLFGSKERRILILGLDGAGKTTILYSFMDSKYFKKDLYISSLRQEI